MPVNTTGVTRERWDETARDRQHALFTTSFFGREVIPALAACHCPAPHFSPLFLLAAVVRTGRPLWSSGRGDRLVCVDRAPSGFRSDPRRQLACDSKCNDRLHGFGWRSCHRHVRASVCLLCLSAANIVGDRSRLRGPFFCPRNGRIVISNVDVVRRAAETIRRHG